MKEFGEFGDLLIFLLVGIAINTLMALQIPKGVGICLHKHMCVRKLGKDGEKPCLI